MIREKTTALNNKLKLQLPNTLPKQTLTVLAFRFAIARLAG